MLWLTMSLLQCVFKKGLISDLAFVVSAYLSTSLAFGLFGIFIQALIGAMTLGIAAFYWHFVLKP